MREAVPGLNLLANPLRTGENTLEEVLPDVSVGTSVYEIQPTTAVFAQATKRERRWTGPAARSRFAPGKGFYLLNKETHNVQVLFAGEVMQGDLRNTIPDGYSLLGSMAPLAGRLDELGFPKVTKDRVLLFDAATATFDLYTCLLFGHWTPAEPSVGISEGFVCRKYSGFDWI